MTSTKRSFRRLTSRPETGCIRNLTSERSSSVVCDAGNSYVPIGEDDLIREALQILSKRLMRSHALQGTQTTRQYLAMRFAGLEHEVFTCLYLDSRYRIITCEDLFRGTVDTTSVHMREVVKRALAHNAAAVIFAHNHPSGVAEPSRADEWITRQLKEALALVGVSVLDHFVVGGAEVVSLSERGLL